MLSDEHLQSLARGLGNDYTFLGALLRIDRAVVEQVEHEFPTTVSTTYELLKIWRHSHRVRDTIDMVDELCKVVSEMGRSDLKDRVKHGELPWRSGIACLKQRSIVRMSYCS